jgi:hypothetical protein
LGLIPVALVFMLAVDAINNLAREHRTPPPIESLSIVGWWQCGDHAVVFFTIAAQARRIGTYRHWRGLTSKSYRRMTQLVNGFQPRQFLRQQRHEGITSKRSLH